MECARDITVSVLAELTKMKFGIIAAYAPSFEITTVEREDGKDEAERCANQMGFVPHYLIDAHKMKDLETVLRLAPSEHTPAREQTQMQKNIDWFLSRPQDIAMSLHKSLDLALALSIPAMYTVLWRPAGELLSLMDDSLRTEPVQPDNAHEVLNALGPLGVWPTTKRFFDMLSAEADLLKQ